MGKRYKRLGYTAAQSEELWDRWQRGERDVKNGYVKEFLNGDFRPADIR